VLSGCVGGPCDRAAKASITARVVCWQRAHLPLPGVSSRRPNAMVPWCHGVDGYHGVVDYHAADGYHGVGSFGARLGLQGQAPHRHPWGATQGSDSLPTFFRHRDPGRHGEGRPARLAGVLGKAVGSGAGRVWGLQLRGVRAAGHGVRGAGGAAGRVVLACGVGRWGDRRPFLFALQHARLLVGQPTSCCSKSGFLQGRER